MFQFEKDMIPVLKTGLSTLYDTKYFAAEFNCGNGVADLVFTTKITDETLILNDYSLMSLFVHLINNKKKLNKKHLYESCKDKPKLKELLDFLEQKDHIQLRNENFVQTRKYKPHTHDLISIEAKLKDWKSGVYQALRYQFFSHKTFLAYPSQYIHRIDVNLLKQHNIGLISVMTEGIKILFNPKRKKPIDLASHFFLSENFAQKFKIIDDN